MWGVRNWECFAWCWNWERALTFPKSRAVLPLTDVHSWARRGATQQAGPPVTSTGSGSKPKLTLTSSIHAFVCSLDLFSLVETGTFSPVLPVICSFIGFVGWPQFWLLLIFLLVHSTGLSHSWAGWQLLPSPCSPSSCISFRWDTLSLSGVSKAFFNCLCHLEKNGF